MSASVRLTGVENVVGNLKKCSINTMKQIVQDSDMIAGEMEAHSKNTRPWTDRTGNARQSIYGHRAIEENSIVIYHGIRVTYGVYLELSHGGRFRVIGPTTNMYRSIWKNRLGKSLRS